ncbi:hypothetical protein OEZ86_003607 [Tetradesmus obliquus]|nr:hypothetical protein OEZ86_003607 [Tetradesmus obliquus]
MGTIIQAKQDATFEGKTTFSTSVLVGKRDEPLLTVAARQLVEHANSKGSTKPLLCCLAFKQHTPETVKQLLAVRPASLNRASTRINVATCRPKVLQSLDLHDAEESEVEGLGIIPRSWGTPAGRLLSQGEHVCNLDALKHLGISCEAGPIVLGRGHFYAALLSMVFGKLQRRHVGSWLLEAAPQPEAAAVFEAHPELKAWLVQLAEQRFGRDGFLLVQQDSPAAAEAAAHLQTLSACFGRELHSVPVAFPHNTPSSARKLLLAWLLELPEAQAGPEGGPEGLTASQDQVRLVLTGVLALLPYKPSLMVKQLPAADSAEYRSRVHVRSNVPAAAALAAAARRRALAAGAAAAAVAAGCVDGRASICITTEVLGRGVSSAAFVVLAAAMQGLDLSPRQCAAAFEAVGAAAAPAAAAGLVAAELRSSAQEKSVKAGSSWRATPAAIRNEPGSEFAAKKEAKEFSESAAVPVAVAAV